MKLMKKAMLGAALVQLMLPILYFVVISLPQSGAWETVIFGLVGLFTAGISFTPHIPLPEMSYFAEACIRIPLVLMTNFIVYSVLFYACLRLWNSRKNGDHFDAPIAMNPAQ